MTKFLTITVEPTEEALLDAWKRADGPGKPLNERRPLEDDIAYMRRLMTIKQRVHVDSAKEWIASMREQGRAVVDVKPSVPPIA